MDEAEKKAAEAAEKAAKEAEAEAAAASAAAEKKAKEGSIDYEAELAKIKKSEEDKNRELVQAKHVIEELKRKKKEEGGNDNPDVDALIDTKLEAIRQENAKALEVAKAELAGDAVEDEIGRLTSDPKAQELIRHHYQNSVVKSGLSRAQVRDDVKKAFVLAHSPVVERFASEAAHAHGAKSATNTAYAGGHSKENPNDLSADDEAQIALAVRMSGMPEATVRANYLKNKSA